MNLDDHLQGLFHEVRQHTHTRYVMHVPTCRGTHDCPPEEHPTRKTQTSLSQDIHVRHSDSCPTERLDPNVTGTAPKSQTKGNRSDHAESLLSRCCPCVLPLLSLSALPLVFTLCSLCVLFCSAIVFMSHARALHERHGTTVEKDKLPLRKWARSRSQSSAKTKGRKGQIISTLTETEAYGVDSQS